MCWCGRRESNPYDQRSRDFKSLASTNSATSAPFSFQLLRRFRQSALCSPKIVLCKTAFPFSFAGARFCHIFWSMLAASNLFLDMPGILLAQARRAAPSASAPVPASLPMRRMAAA